MNNNSPVIANLHDLLDYEARKFTGSEVQLKNMLPQWISVAGSMQLKAVLLKYLNFVEQHVEKFELFISEDKISSLSIDNRIMDAFIEEAEEKLSYCNEIQVKDACLISCIQSINHYKISSYGTAAAFAQTLGMEKAAEIFREAEVNEKQIDIRLTQLAEFEINLKASTPIELPS